MTKKSKEFGIFCPHCKKAIKIKIDIVDYSLSFEVEPTA